MSERPIMILTGGFDPLHDGHLDMFEAAVNHGYDILVGVNSDNWLTRKKGKPFLPMRVRKRLVESLSTVYLCTEILAEQDIEGHIAPYLKAVRQLLPKSDLYFGNGGDRDNITIPKEELTACKTLDINPIFGLGASKRNSSSAILNSWCNVESVIRDWGTWDNIRSYDNNTTKIKNLIIQPLKSLSWQKHNNRSEIWFVKDGIIGLELSEHRDHGSSLSFHSRGDVVRIPEGRWHRMFNKTKNPASVIEIQYGSSCVEEDIERHARPF